MTALHDLQQRSVADEWAELEQQRLNWALRAYRSFMDSLSKETRERFARGEGDDREAYVVVFGKTQVGKTTLLLDLMGVSATALPRVSHVLRGKREGGRSATATAMEYRRSNDEHWHLDTGSGPCAMEDDARMTDELARIRERMSQRRLHADQPMVVWIPASCFEAGAAQAPRVRMLDLPGDNPADETEREHVQRMARQYVPHADLILLVGRSEDLSFLCPEALCLPSIEDWQIVPARFRIVTTYSFLPQSVRDYARQNLDKLTTDFFRQRLLEQIGTHGLKLSDDARDLRRFFPLEFGQSWSDAVRKQDELVKHLAPIITELKRQLHADISQSTTEMARLRNAVDVHLVVKKVKEARLKKMDEERVHLRESFVRVQENVRIIASALQQASDKAKNIFSFLENLPLSQIRQQVQLLAQIDIEEDLGKVDRLSTNVGAFRSLISEFGSSLTRKFMAVHPPIDSRSLKEFWKGVNPRLENRRSDVAQLVSKEFSGLHSRLSGYRLDEYYPSISSDFSDDKGRMRRDMRDAAQSVGTLATDIWSGMLNERLKSIKAELTSAQASEAALKLSLEREESELAKLRDVLASHDRERIAFKAKMKADEEVGENFTQMLNEEYLIELEQRHNRITAADTTASSFINLLGTFQLTQVRRKIMIGMK